MNTPDSWEEEYEERFGSLRFRGNPKEAIKHFIREQIARERARVAAEIWEDLEPKGTWIGAGETKIYVIPWVRVDASISSITKGTE